MRVECKELQDIKFYTKCNVVKYCCKKMKKAMSDVKEDCGAPKTGGGSAYYGDRVIWDSYFKIVDGYIEIPTHHNNEWCEKYTKISYCPFCGEEIK